MEDGGPSLIFIHSLFIYIYFNQIIQRKPYYFISFFSHSASGDGFGSGSTSAMPSLSLFVFYFLFLLSLLVGEEDKVCVLMQSKSPTAKSPCFGFLILLSPAQAFEQYPVT